MSDFAETIAKTNQPVSNAASPAALIDSHMGQRSKIASLSITSFTKLVAFQFQYDSAGSRTCDLIPQTLHDKLWALMRPCQAQQSNAHLTTWPSAILIV